MATIMKQFNKIQYQWLDTYLIWDNHISIVVQKHLMNEDSVRILDLQKIQLIKFSNSVYVDIDISLW